MQPEVANALAEAANLLLVGMIVVFLFLSMLIGAITLISWVNALFPEEPENISSNRKSTATPQTGGVSPKTVAIISAAINQHRQSH